MKLWVWGQSWGTTKIESLLRMTKLLCVGSVPLGLKEDKHLRKHWILMDSADIKKTNSFVFRTIDGPDWKLVYEHLPKFGTQLGGYHPITSSTSEKRTFLNQQPCGTGGAPLVICWFTIHLSIWLVVSTPLKNISQLGSLFPIYGKIKNVPNHQPVYSILVFLYVFYSYDNYKHNIA